MWELYLNPEASIENRDSSYVVPYTFEKKKWDRRTELKEGRQFKLSLGIAQERKFANQTKHFRHSKTAQIKKELMLIFSLWWFSDGMYTHVVSGENPMWNLATLIASFFFCSCLVKNQDKSTVEFFKGELAFKTWWVEHLKTLVLVYLLTKF